MQIDESYALIFTQDSFPFPQSEKKSAVVLYAVIRISIDPIVIFSPPSPWQHAYSRQLWATAQFHSYQLFYSDHLWECVHHIPGGGDMLCLAGVRCYYPQPVLFTFPANPELQLMRQEREGGWQCNWDWLLTAVPGPDDLLLEVVVLPLVEVLLGHGCCCCGDVVVMLSVLWWWWRLRSSQLTVAALHQPSPASPAPAPRSTDFPPHQYWHFHTMYVDMPAQMCRYEWLWKQNAC